MQFFNALHKKTKQNTIFQNSFMIMAKNEILSTTDEIHVPVFQKLQLDFELRIWNQQGVAFLTIWSFLVESPLKQNLLKMVGMKKKPENKNQSKALKKKRNLTHKEWHQA